jgi:pimeloyl-ACP methyl ester carboxylesterase
MVTRNFIFLILFYFLPIFVLGIRPDSTYAFTPQARGMMYKEFQVKTSDNIQLNVWFYPAQELLSEDSMKKYLDNEHLEREYVVDESIKKPTILICNGDANNMAYLLGFATFLCPNGYNVVTFDWRGFGKSQEWKFGKDIACQEFIIDYNTVLDTLIKLPGVDSSRIGAFGFSTGAYISFLQFPLRKEIKALTVRGMFTSYADVVKYLDVIKGTKQFYPSIFDDEDYKAIAIAPNIYKPIFLLLENMMKEPRRKCL